jgi:predicted nucleotidyltransferase component of viral defense system
MISLAELRRISRDRKLALDLVEKDYAIGWVLHGISSSSISDELVLKGGTALSKVYFPFGWRLSEDLDFTVSESCKLEAISAKLTKELPSLVDQASDGLILNFRDKPFMNPRYLQARVQYTGPLGKNTVKLEVSKEAFVGDVKRAEVPKAYDYPQFSILAYTLENILAEKMRSILERERIRDYYDVWRLLKVSDIHARRAKELFIKKCEMKGLTFHGLEQFFPEDIVETLKTFLQIGLTRLSSEPAPSLEKMIQEMRKDLKTMIA